MKAISIHAPWAWAILQGHKRIENRSWAINYRGPLAIHAGKSRASDAAALAVLAAAGIAAPSPDTLDALRGRFVALVDLIDIVDYPNAGGDGLAVEASAQSLLDDPFATGPKCWILGEPRSLGTRAIVRGRQGIWTPADFVK